jgi:UDP-N-acetylglucosamine diphosphorylase/glucosamine-1-phosphate N-acetyltransferase
MIAYNLFDDSSRYTLLPFTHTRPIADIRCGLFTARERWQHLSQQEMGTITEEALQKVFPAHVAGDYVYINARIMANADLWQAITQLRSGETLQQQGIIIAHRSVTQLGFEALPAEMSLGNGIEYTHPLTILEKVWQIFEYNEAMIVQDFEYITKGRASALIPSYVTAINPEQIFIEPGAILNPCILNASSGPIYIAKDAEVLDGALLRGPIALGEHAVVKMGPKIYGGTTIGPGCKVGGEISNVVFFANSNKGHDGYLGNAIIGEWCNLGADTNCSNLKNNYDEVKIWDEKLNKSIKTGLQFCGLIMGDHSKCGINTMFNTGTVVGVSCNLFGAGFPEKFIPSFTWGGAEGMQVYLPNKAIETANKMMARRKLHLTESETALLHHVFEMTSNQRALLNIN